MRKFAEYPIRINYNLHTQLRYKREEDQLYRAGQYEAERQLFIKTTTTSDSGIENNLWKHEIDQYEATVYKCLQKIDSNPVGRMVLKQINPMTTVWIIPKADADMKAVGTYNAQTHPLKYDIQWNGDINRGFGSGDTVIWFHPKLGDDTLFHELVHAYRYSHNKWDQIKIVFVGSMPRDNSEEFFAHEMENIYLSQNNRQLTKFYQGPFSNKEEIYDFLVKNSQLMQTLKYFLRHEYLAMLAAHSCDTSYNPFRDYRMLEERYRKGDPSQQELPELSPIPGATEHAPKSGPRRLQSFIPAAGGPRRNPGPIGIS